METHLRCRKRPAGAESYTRAAPGDGAMEPPDQRDAIEYGQMLSCYRWLAPHNTSGNRVEPIAIAELSHGNASSSLFSRSRAGAELLACRREVQRHATFALARDSAARGGARGPAVSPRAPSHTPDRARPDGSASPGDRLQCGC